MISVNKYTEEELVGLLQQRREEGFSYLYDHYSAALNGVICSVVGDETIAADVLQEVFVNIFRRIESYDPGKSRLFTWLLNIARNASIDMVRSKGFRNAQQNREVTENVYQQAGGSLPQVDYIGLRGIIGRLKQEQKQVIELAYFSGYTQEEISEILEIPLGTVKTRVRAGLKQLRELLS